MSKHTENREYRSSAEALLAFIKKSPSCFHVVQNLSEQLEQEGFLHLPEARRWDLKPGGKYFVTRNTSSVIAFRIPEGTFGSYQMICSHTDSPTFKVKEIPELSGGECIRLNVEKYGGPLLAPWFDRPLSVAGRLMVRKDDQIQSVLVNVDRDLLIIPSLAIHMNREANTGYNYHVQKDLCPLFAGADSEASFLQLIAETAKVERENILGADLFLYDRTPGTFLGAGEEFIASPKLDDLQSLYTSFTGFLQAENADSITVFGAFDNEETGSMSRQGADSPFLADTLSRISSALGKTQEEHLAALASSFLLSADNAHAMHPNYPEKSDAKNYPKMNGGIVLKYNANQKYTTDARSAAMFRLICERAGVPCQTFANHSDQPGGSTLGNIANTHVAMYSADIGMAQLAMHSPYETAGAYDCRYMEQLARAFYQSSLVIDEQENIRVKS
jgi:aspartyl aminopeptidase